MASSSQGAPDRDLTEPLSSPGFKPYVTGAVSRPSRAHDDALAEEPGSSYDNETEVDDRPRKVSEDKRPWWKRPSPWWMLTMMPISAMTLAGVNPSLYQVYTELVCRSIRDDASSRLALKEPPTPRWSILDVREVLSTSPVEEREYTVEASTQSDDTYMWLQGVKNKEEEPSCASDPVVQAAVSRLVTALLTTQGILSCITAASWASLSDRLGRRPILTLTSSAVIICYSIFIFVYYSSDHLPGGYWILLFGTIIYGVLGGSAGTTAATNAYIADCTPVTDRAEIFSLTLGLRFTGMAIGPTLNSLLVRSAGTPIAALALVVCTHVVYVLLMVLVVPESLSSEKRTENRRIWREARDGAASQETERNEDSIVRRVSLVLLSLGNAALAFLRPLSVAGPITVAQPSGRTHRDWSLTFITISACLASIILSSYTSMFQFGAAKFGWTAIELGYWYSGIVAARALTLTLILPVIIKIYHYFTGRSPKSSSATSHADTESSDATPLLSPPHNDTDAPVSQPPPSPNARDQSEVQKKQIQKTPAFDLAIAQFSLALEVVCYALVPVLFSRGPVIYIILTVLASCGAGFGPAIQALAVDLYAGRGGTETGKLFGVLSVVQTISSQILGPTIYGITYMKIVSFYPEGIFFVSVAAVASSLTFLLFVELPGKKGTAVSRAVESSV